MPKYGPAMTPSHTYAKHEPWVFPCSRLRLTARQIAIETRLGSVNNAGGTTLVRTSRLARDEGSLINGSSMSSSISRLPSCDHVRSYSRRASSAVGCDDHSTPKCR